MPSGPNLLHPAPPWTSPRSREVTLWHGCASRDVAAIQTHGIDLARCRHNTDFGLGFYLTTLERQARHWAWVRYYGLPHRLQSGTTPQVLRFRVPRVELAGLETLAFVSGDYDALDFWSLVQHCRQSAPPPRHHHHQYPDLAARPDGWYDVVVGPVAAFWRQRVAMPDADQVSFHTPRSVRVLQNLIDANDPDRFEIVAMP